MNTSLTFMAPPDFSVGDVRISNESGIVHEWKATPDNLVFPTKAAAPGYYSAEITPAGVAPQTVIFEVKAGQANSISLPPFSSLMANGTGPNFLDVEDRQTALRALYRSDSATASIPIEAKEPTPVAIDTTRKRFTVGLSQEQGTRREAYGPFNGSCRYEMVGEQVVLEVHAEANRDPWEGLRARLSTSIEGVKIERQLLPLYRGGTRISITPSPLASADVEYQVMPLDSRRRALARALQGGTPDDAVALRQSLLASEGLSELLRHETGDPWGAMLAGLLFIRFPDSLGKPDREWITSMLASTAWAYDSHVIAARELLMAAGEAPGAQQQAAEQAVGSLAQAQQCGSPYYSYASQLFGEMAESLHAYLDDTGSGTAKIAETVLARWRREMPLQSSSDVTFTWLSRDSKALKQKGILTPLRSPSGQLRARDTTVLLTGLIEGGRITLGRSTGETPQHARKASLRPPQFFGAESRYPAAGLTSDFAVDIPFPQALPPPLSTGAGSSVDPGDDPNLGQFGGMAQVAGFRVDASFRPGANRNWAAIVMTVTADENAELQLGDVAVFHLHPTFPQREVTVMFNDRRATLSLQAWGGFTLGVTLPRQQVNLECNLAALEGAPKIIRTR